ncbi:MAG: hypothetical protein OXR62_16185 [Ahrensia sp.]|nr:hypothetical protein [Ahrensia sp.]
MGVSYYSDRDWQVTDSIVRTPRKTFSLEKLEAVSLKRTFFLFAAGPAVGCIIITLLWWRYLYVGEIATLLAASTIALITSFQFGALKVDALSLKDDEGGIVFGRFNQLARVRDAIEQAMQDSRSINIQDAP